MILTKVDYLNYPIQGKIIIFPTDTVYGIACLYQDEKSIQRIYDIKHRDYTRPMALLCASIEQVKQLIRSDQLLDSELIKYWPGKLTLVFKKSSLVTDIITAGKDTVGVRIPDNPIALALLEKYGPMVVTSLNETNEPPIIKFQDTLKYQASVDYIVEGGDLNNQPSTVYDTLNKRVLRQGEIIIKD